MQILQRKYPTQMAQPGKPEKREHTYIRHGGRAFLASCVVPTGQGVWNLGMTRPREDCAAPLRPVVAQRPDRARDDWVIDHLKTHWSLDVCRVVASGGALPWPPKTLARGSQRRAVRREPTPTPGVHGTPTPGSWRHPVALWCSVVARRCRTRGDFCAGEDCEARLCDALEASHTHDAPP